ncbi:hypothetical protein XENOCAPTIV_011572 [Xenoophorus captivus]|uniref:Uncharacterized protein n=1 Tax=Xenoophorus captivus TaxID=1517983 RepID=A0ABV0QRA0_9TELE
MFPNLDTDYTSLGEHPYLTAGKCSGLRGCYTPEHIKTVIGLERYRRGLIAHPEAIIVPDAWKGPDITLTYGTYVKPLCYLCGSDPGKHQPDSPSAFAEGEDLIPAEASRSGTVGSWLDDLTAKIRTSQITIEPAMLASQTMSDNAVTDIQTKAVTDRDNITSGRRTPGADVSADPLSSPAAAPSYVELVCPNANPECFNFTT